ncbi:hypothetical protein R1flu_008749 [Riccia fluitans]|uniref:Secreted protein n=1 Tax=Riccia fluitans TaxID=41844 RepID=A0ABD1YDM3_9MARC
MAAHLSVTIVGRGAAIGTKVLTTACVTSIALCPDVQSTIGPLPVVVETGSSAASLAGFNDTDLSSDFLDQISLC